MEISFDDPQDPAKVNALLDRLRAGGGQIETLTRQPVSLETLFTRLTEPGPDGEGEPELQFSPAEPPGPEAMEPPPANVRQGVWPGLQHAGRVAWATLRRDVQAEVSYRFSFLLQFVGMFFSVAVFYFVAQLLGEAAAPFLAPYGGDYFAFVLIGIAFAGYFGVGLSGFSSSLRNAQTTGTLEAMLTTPTGVSTIIVSASLWDYLLTTLRVLVYLFIGAVFLGVDLGQGNYPAALVVLVLTIISFSSLGIIAASFIMVLKRGDPVTWAIGALSTLLGGVYYPIAVLPGWMQALVPADPGDLCAGGHAAGVAPGGFVWRAAPGHPGPGGVRRGFPAGQPGGVPVCGRARPGGRQPDALLICVAQAGCAIPA